jgi:DNA-binding winged helix-turn-helix (wHTH) protein/tetratricopeptide (TPR) repeat protein
MYVAGVLVPVRPKECEVLAYLLAHCHRVVSKDELLEQVWPGQFVGDATLHVRILAVRKAIGDDGTTARLLRTVRGRGYRFVAPVITGAPPVSETAGSPPTALMEKPPFGGLLPTATMEEPSTIVTSLPMPGSADTGEHKVVTVLCGGLVEATDWEEWLGAEAMYQLMQTLLARVQNVVQHEHLRVLQHAEILYEKQAFSEAVYTFKHALIHEVVYSSLLQERRRLLHARIVERLEALDANRLVDQIDLLAHHALRGEVWDKAVVYCRQAGTRAMTQSAYHEAARSFEQALDALQHLPEGHDTHVQAIDLRLDLRSAIYPLGELERILVYLREAAALAEALGDQHRLGWVSAFLTTHYTQVGEPDHALTCGQRTLAIATNLEDVGLTVMAQHNLGQVYRNLGDYRRAVACYQKNVAGLHGEFLRECFGLPGLASVISRSFLTLSLAECGAFAAGRVPAEAGVRLAEAADHPYSRVQAYRAVGFRALRQGDVRQAISVLERALDLAQGARLRLLVPRVAALVGTAYTLAGRATDALPLLEQAVEQATAIRYMLDHALRVVWPSEAYLLAGRPDEAYTQALPGRARRSHSQA